MKSFIFAIVLVTLTVPSYGCAGRNRTPVLSKPLLRDSANVLIEAIAAVVDSGSATRSQRRIWLHQSRNSGSSDSERVFPATQLLQILRDTFPGLVIVEPNASLFLCAQGERVLMPGHGCPIRDDGLIITVRAPRFDSDSARVGVGIIQSRDHGSGYSTWESDFGVDMVRSGAIWRLRKKTLLRIS
jgi:hypothetical protein